MIADQASTRTQHLRTVTVIAKTNRRAEQDTTLLTAASRRRGPAKRAMLANINLPKTAISIRVATTKLVATQVNTSPGPARPQGGGAAHVVRENTHPTYAKRVTGGQRWATASTEKQAVPTKRLAARANTFMVPVQANQVPAKRASQESTCRVATDTGTQSAPRKQRANPAPIFPARLPELLAGAFNAAQARF